MTAEFIQGDCLEELRKMPEDSADLVFGSPPYEKARLYLEDGQNLGISRNTRDWVDWMIAVTAECVRVCKGLVAFVVEGQTRQYRYSCGPILLMAHLHQIGFNLRKPPIFQRIGIPGSGGPDWLRNDYEFIICVTRPGRLPWSDNTACGHPPKWAPGGAMSHQTVNGRRVVRGTQDGDTRTEDAYRPPALANPGNVIKCKVGGGLMGSNWAHLNEAPFPELLPEFFIKSFCPPGGKVLDPFSGSGTTVAVANRLERNAIGIDMRASQCEIGKKRLAGERSMFD